MSLRAGLASGSRALATLCLSSLPLAALCAPPPASAAIRGVGPGGCPVTAVVGTDTTAASSPRPLSIGRGLAQSFDAPDSLVTSVVVWLPGYRSASGFRMHLWITGSAGDGRPRPEDVIADGGRLDLPHGSSVKPLRCQVDFVPPVALPSRGRYALALVAEDCGVMDVLTTARAAAGVSELWETSLRGCSNGPGTARARIGSGALVFRVEFCDVGTGAIGHTWGEIKTIYR